MRRLNIRIIPSIYTGQELYEIVIVLRYRLLPSDATTVLTCKHYGIDTILTLDEDFKRVPWLKVIP
ncbi:MAG: PIN domain-containing protein [Ignisphaera sp.]